MHKYRFVIFHQEYDEALAALKQMGIVHLKKKDISSCKQIEALLIERREVQQLINLLALRANNINAEEEYLHTDGEEFKKDVQNLIAHLDTINHQLLAVEKELIAYLPWGYVNWETINQLEDHGLNIHLFKCPKQKLNSEWAENHLLIPIETTGNILYFIIIETEVELSIIDAEEVKLTPKKLQDILDEKTQWEEEVRKSESRIDFFATHGLHLLVDLKIKIENKIQEFTVQQSTDEGVEGKIKILQGWIPQDSINEFQEYIADNELYCEELSEDKEDIPPVKLRNNSFTRLFEPVGLLFSLPNYKELDLTPFFAPFFLLFFGFCLGDAGYGILFVVFAFFIKNRVNEVYRSMLRLVQYLGIATVVFGIITGTVFGISLIDSGYTFSQKSLIAMQEIVTDFQSESLSLLVGKSYETQNEYLRAIEGVLGADFTAQNKESIIRASEASFGWLQNIRHLFLTPSMMFPLALILGAIQIIIGLFLKVMNQIKQKGFSFAGSELGWFTAILSSTLFATLDWYNQQEHYLFSVLHLIILLLAGIGIFIYNSPQRNIFVNVGVGIWDTYGMLTGILGDLLSYIRLFALGLSSAILGLVFNQLAFNMSPDIPFIHELFIILILLIGHGINLFMSGLGAFVHPLRLTFVEFYKNAGFTGGGKPYEPYKQIVE